MRDTNSFDLSHPNDPFKDPEDPTDLQAIAVMLRQIARWTEDYGLRDAIHHVEEARGLILQAIQDGRHLQ
ncbi:hypothetical protein ACP4J4_20025 (plasmid) [Aureimonas ureilytica]|uniref:hypothetical protein n=1 Tax=Aureimonas ureilytica TaxID=401562 RepID=UPI003CFA4EC1